MATQQKCPVCAMEATGNAPSADYLGMHFVFCSLQCRERFLANPHLYIGIPGQKAPAQAGRTVLKRRRLPLAERLDAQQATEVESALGAMMGIVEVNIPDARDLIEVTYDLIQATEAQLERELEQAGARLGGGWGERLRRAFVHYLEETEVENLEVKPGHGGHGHHH